MFSDSFSSRWTGYSVIACTLFLFLNSPLLAQSEIGSRGGQTAPAPTVTPTPVLPPSLTLPPSAASSLLQGLNSSGAAMRPGMGWLVSDLTHQGIRGRELADIIHQLKPYKQRGVLTFPQNQQTTTLPAFPNGNRQPALLPGADKGHGHGNIMPGGGRGFGKGKR